MEELPLNKSESKYFNTAIRMDEAMINILGKKDFQYITVKEICEKAGVNRSTFYLHYENTKDLLMECIEHMNKQFFTYFNENEKTIGYRIQNDSQSDLMFINDMYLFPYLQYIKDNRHIFSAVLKKTENFGVEETYDRLFKNVISPIMDKYKIQEKEKGYISSFYIHGIIAVVNQWIKDDCKMSIEEIAAIIKKCILRN